jgi:glucose-1-phosphate cytidylyltransferase
MKYASIPVVILAGGLGTRLREETEFRPKPMVPIGGKPIIWHIMKIYAHFGFRRFIICLGYKGEMIKNYFLNYRLEGVDLTINTKTGSITEHQLNDDAWEITMVDTGPNTMTGGRVARVARYIDADHFCLTYGDGLANINLDQLMQFHQAHQKLATVTGVSLASRFGHLEIKNDQVTAFAEKKQISDEWINGGFMVLAKDALHYLSTQESCVFEQEPLKHIASDGQLMMYKHHGFWQCMDTYREHQMLEELWQKTAPWKVWQEQEKVYIPAVKQPTRTLCPTSKSMGESRESL